MSKQRTFAIFKPDLVAQNKHGEVLQRILDEGFDVLGMRQVRMCREEAAAFYAEHQGKPFYDPLCTFMSSGPSIVLCLERDDAIAHWRSMIGATSPAEAAEGTIRKQFGTASPRNAVHGSDCEESAHGESSFFFRQTELL